MIKNILLYETNNTNPYDNLALEAYFVNHCPVDSMIIYLWQNRHTVVIGKNQNPWKECNLEKMDEDGVFLARRPSGGGAVYHDMGNLNFSFVSHKDNYDIPRQLGAVCRALKSFGIQAVPTGRNDIAVGERKISGNAFLHTGGGCCHHGTILVDVNTEEMAKYLHASDKKLKSKGVDSVKARVVNAKELCPAITLDALKIALIQAGEEEYQAPVSQIDDKDINAEEVRRMASTFSSWQWRLGQQQPFEAEISDRFDWGEITLQFAVDGGIVQDVFVYSDAMSTDWIQQIPSLFRGQPFLYDKLAAAVAPLLQKDQYKQESTDLQSLLARQKGDAK